jgi:hypothetical protein
MWLSAFRGDKSVKDGMLYTHYFAVRAGRYRGFEFFILTYGLSLFCSKSRLSLDEEVPTPRGNSLSHP